MKTIIERGASWTLEETKLLLRLWGKDLVERQSSGTKRTKEVYEKIADKFNESGHERTADQVRTRIFNMIAEYRRILKDNNPEREKKCIFFAALHKIYQARHMEDVKSALDDYEPDYPYSPHGSVTLQPYDGMEDESNSDSEATDGNESINQSIIANASTNVTATNNNDVSINSTNNTTNTAASNTTNTTGGNKYNNNSNNNTKFDSKDGDSNNNTNNNEKESSSNASSHHPHHHNQRGATPPAKKVKLESPKASSNQSATIQNSHSDHLNVNSKQNKSSSTSSSATQAATTSNAASGAPTPTSSSSSSSTTLPNSATASTSTSLSSAQRHQSLLLPHATAATSSPLTTTSTPINKLTTSGSNNTPSYININSTKLPIIRTNQLIGHSNGNESINLNGTTTRLPTTAAISHQLYQAPVNTFDVTSSALLIDRMFAHLSRESENMREWIALEKERLALERTRRQQETEREVRRERVLIDTLMRFQEQWLSFLTRLDPRIVENSNEQPPELRIPAKEAPSAEASQSSSAATSANSINHPETSK